MNTKRLKVLLCCYACDPTQGSEPGVGWQFARIISQHHDTHVIVEEKFKNNIELYTNLHPEISKNITFHYIKRERHKILRKMWPPSYYSYYIKWQREAYQYAKKLHAEHNFDLVHQITLAGYRVPGFMWKLNIPFIWGPIGGLNQTSWRLLPGMGIYGCIFYTFRNLINLFQKRWSKTAHQAARKAHTIIVSDPDASHVICNIWKRAPLIMREVGVHPSSSPREIQKHNQETPLRVCWAGVHVPRKALNLVIQALPLCSQKIHLDVLGAGPCSSSWQKLAKKLGVEHQVTFHGKLPHNQVFDIMSRSHTFCLSSISEGGTTSIVMEALQQGLPIISLNHCAYATVIDDSCGIKISITSPKQISADFALALDKLASNEELRIKLAEGAKKRSKQFTWDSKMAILNRIYANAAQSSYSSAPDYIYSNEC